MTVLYTLDPEDIAAARLLAIGIRPRLELALFAVAVAALLCWSISPWSFALVPLLIGLTASLGAFRLMQIGKVREAAMSAFRRNPTLRRPTTALWDERGVTIEPAGSAVEFIPWTDMHRLVENERVMLIVQHGGQMHAIPKRAFPDKAVMAAFRRALQSHLRKMTA